MTVETTSIMSYYDEDNQRMFETVRDYVYYIVQNAYKPSSSDISRIGNLARNTVTGRLKELEEDGLIEKRGPKMDPFTHKQVFYYVVKGESP